MDIIAKLSEELSIKQTQIEAAVGLIDEGNTIPFIARYRKEVTGSLDDEQLRALSERLNYLRGLEKRKEEVRAAITEQGKMTEEIDAALASAEILAEVEDIYRPFKQKRKTRASQARERGLAPLAELIMAQEPAYTPSIEEAAESFVNEEKGVKDAKAAIAGAHAVHSSARVGKALANGVREVKLCAVREAQLARARPGPYHVTALDLNAERYRLRVILSLDDFILQQIFHIFLR